MCFLALIQHRVLRMRLKQERRTESRARLLEQLRRVHQQSASTPGGHVVHGVTKLAAEQKDLFAAIGVPNPKPQELAEPASTAARAFDPVRIRGVDGKCVKTSSRRDATPSRPRSSFRSLCVEHPESSD